MNQLTAMQAFKRVVELNSFTAAARDLGLSNAAVSKNISELEAHLGVQLVTRTTRRISVTEVGEAYYARCVRILDDLAEADQRAGSASSTPRGRLRINAPMSFGILHLAPAISDFLDRHAKIEVDLVMDDRYVDLIEGDFDIGVRVTSELKDSSWIARKLSPIRRVLCGAPSYFERFGTPVTPEDLREHRCLIYSLSASPSAWPFTGPDGPQTVGINGCFRANNSLALRQALLDGVGISLLPAFIVGEDLRRGSLVEVMTELTPAPHTLYVVYPQARHVSQKVRAFVDFMVERFAAVPEWSD
ncbi:MAG: LysR family transcriptional regulator [Alphaproteobacteria bacterium]|nr:LysR family transcriptional regulator [Alphaproteobacteria bacterium]